MYFLSGSCGAKSCNQRSIRLFVFAIALASSLICPRTIFAVDYSQPPGVVIDYVPASTETYVGCPSIAILPSGDYVATHSFFGPSSTLDQSVVFRSQDRGETWQQIVNLDGQWWSNLFVHNDALYIMGVNRQWGSVVIRRSDDGGQTWTVPQDSDTGLLRDDGQYHTAPVPVLFHNGRIWRALEVDHAYPGQDPDPHPYSSFVMSAPVESDLLNASSWTTTNMQQFDLSRVGKEPDDYSGGWREGNILATPDGGLVDFLRIDDAGADRADILSVSADGTQISIDDENWGLVDFPGGRTKFTIRYDPISELYWSLSNKQTDPYAKRNILVLTSSADLKTWEVNSVILRHPDTEHHAFQYVDWQFDGDDLVAVSRTAYGDSNSYHNANYFTFHRITDFRTRTMEDPPLFDPSFSLFNGDFEETPFTCGWTVTDPVAGDGKDLVYRTTGLTGTANAVWLQADEYNSSAERAEFGQTFSASSPEWRLDLTFASADPDTDANKSDQRSLHLYISFDTGGMIMRVTEDNDFQIYDKEISGYRTIFSDAIQFSTDYDGDKDYSGPDDALNAYRLRVTGHFDSDSPTYDLALTDANGEDFIYVANGLTYWYSLSPHNGDGVTGLLFQPWLADGSCVVDEICLQDIFMPGDANGDGTVDTTDAEALAANWLAGPDATWAMGDFNADGIINDIDASILAANWHTTTGSSNVSEPSVLIGLLSLFLVGFLRRKPAY